MSSIGSSSSSPATVGLEHPPLPPGDPERGRRIYEARGSQCHRISRDGGGFVFHALGPNLYGVMGSPVATVDGPNAHGRAGDGYAYSPASMRARGSLVWTRDAMDHFLENPRKFLPGTSMMFVGLKKPQERADVIAYLETLHDTV